jgi:hypothetical protein
MATKFNVAALGAVLAFLAAPGVVSAQEDFGNYLFAQGLRDTSAAPTNWSQSRMNRFVRNIPCNAFRSVVSPGRRAFETDRDSRDCRPGTASEICARSYRN